MSKPQAIALCRVSTPEQRASNSLNRQEKSVLGEASKLNADVIKWWSGDISSKVGTNVKRKDLKEMQEFCKQNKQVKYLIVDEPDRFMRSIDEAFYFEVLFRELGVSVWYACDPMLNTGDLNSKMLKFSKYFPAEGSNVERITKSISGQTAALNDGRYPFSPKPGYMRGYIKGIPEVHPERGPALRKTLKDVAHNRKSPLEAMKELNESDYIKTRAPLKIDKFLKILADPFNAGITNINKQVKVRNEKASHEKLITLDEHEAILAILDGRKKNKPYTKKQFNPEYPLNKTWCSDCMGVVQGKIVGFNLSNGRGGVYPRYRCRYCWTLYTRDEVHNALDELLDDLWMDENDIQMLVKALEQAWIENSKDKAITINQLGSRISNIKRELERTLDAIIDPANKPYIDNFRDKASKLKLDIEKLSNEVAELEDQKEYDLENFIRFGLEFSQELAGRWRTLEADDLYRFKLLLFPDDFMIGPDKKLYTPKISPIYSLGRTKKGSAEPDFSHLVRVKRL